MNDIEYRRGCFLENELCDKCAEFYYDLDGFLCCHCPYVLHSHCDTYFVEKCKYFVDKKGISKWDSMRSVKQKLFKKVAKQLWKEKMKKGEILPGSGIETSNQFVEFCIKSMKLKDANAK